MKTTVLVIDDDAAIRESIGRVLEGENYAVLLAADGQEALGCHGPERIDIVLLDLELPVRSGWDVFERFTARNPTTPVIVITGHTEDYQTAVDAGVSAFLEKPLDVPRLLRTMRELLAEPEVERLRRLVGRGTPPGRDPPDASAVFEDCRISLALATTWKETKPSS